MEELASELTGWPPVIGMVLIIFILRFHDEIASLIGRVVKVGRQGIQMAPGDQEEANVGRERPADELLAELDNQLIVEREELINQEFEERGITQPQERERVLKRYFAAILTGFEFERLYQSIWGSQLTALQAANSLGGRALSRQRLEQIFQHAQSKWNGPLEEDTFDRWLGYLSNQGLLQVHQHGGEITVKGREFLKYLVEVGYPMDKAF